MCFISEVLAGRGTVALRRNCGYGKHCEFIYDPLTSDGNALAEVSVIEGKSSLGG